MAITPPRLAPRRAFAGADQLLLVSSNDPYADGVALNRAAIEAAVAAKVGRILYTTPRDAIPASRGNPILIIRRRRTPIKREPQTTLKLTMIRQPTLRPPSSARGPIPEKILFVSPPNGLHPHPPSVALLPHGPDAR